MNTVMGEQNGRDRNEVTKLVKMQLQDPQERFEQSLENLCNVGPLR